MWYQTIFTTQLNLQISEDHLFLKKTIGHYVGPQGVSGYYPGHSVNVGTTATTLPTYATAYINPQPGWGVTGQQGMNRPRMPPGYENLQAYNPVPMRLGAPRQSPPPYQGLYANTPASTPLF